MPISRLRVALAITALTLIWGTTWGVIRIGLDGIPPLTGVAARFAVAFVFLFVLIRHRRIPLGRQRHEVALWFVNAVFGFSFTYGAVYWAEQWIPSALASVLFATFPLWVTLLAHFALPGEKMTVRSLCGALIGFGGVALIFSEDLTGVGGPNAWLSAVLVLLATPACAASSVAIKRWGKNIHPLSISGIPMGITAGLAAAAALFLEREREIDLSAASVGAVFYLAILGTAVTFSLYYWLLRHIPATRLSLVAYMTPVVAVLFGTLVLDERLTLRIFEGAGLVVLGVALAGHSGNAKSGRQ